MLCHKILISSVPIQIKTILLCGKVLALTLGADANNIVVGNGSTELISTFIKSVNAKKTVILGPGLLGIRA